ncbi:thioether cross-link-forming SCIFF peptide maturase [Sedimentibacter sp. MB31-C6]|uniref:thioether cross-link-forming SCIFF peptide maturase n=1 Tax=Sedimentibacter sp. MB31-C6 TaxID=3109366 RepID=UPI002DDD78A8|nr:thioether cross-link-forming SCIFF peptide maturase [Sedimentibacter sp. MB36-C1]WSI04478.1 thioether cross-link-forming SCIFF peptide maturase [Sedimentibacter sp. MB36-C1]
MIHVYKIEDMHFVIDTNSGLVHSVDEIIYDLLIEENFKNENKLQELCVKYGQDIIDEALLEIKYLIDNKMLYTEENNIVNRIEPAVKAMCLNMTHDCNLRCEYCFASQGTYNGERAYMSYETGKKAFDYLVKSSGNRINLEVDFFGGEPLMNFDTIKKLVDYGRSLEEKYNKHFRFTITTNGVLLDEEKRDYINEVMDNVVLSIDGRKDINDRMRKTVNNKGSYDIIVENFKKLVDKRKDKDYFARGTFTAYNLDFADDVKHMRDLGFDKISVEPVVAKPEEKYALKEEHIEKLKSEYEKLAKLYIDYKNNDKKFQFFHFNIELDGGPCIYKRSIGCGAGTEYVAVTPEGDYYPCHQFVGEKKFIIGNVDDGITNDEVVNMFRNVSVNEKPVCKDCWAKYYCSGGCHANAYNFNNDFKVPYNVGCELEKKRIECSIFIKAKLQ